jgi:hypothetical protein
LGALGSLDGSGLERVVCVGVGRLLITGASRELLREELEGDGDGVERVVMGLERGAELSRGAECTGASLRRVGAADGGLTGAERGADWMGAEGRGADWIGADGRGADCTGAGREGEAEGRSRWAAAPAVSPPARTTANNCTDNHLRMTCTARLERRPGRWQLGYPVIGTTVSGQEQALA